MYGWAVGVLESATGIRRKAGDVTEKPDTTQAPRPLALVTGASHGIGLEPAKLFVRDGYDLVVVADSDALDSAVADLACTGATIIPVRADLKTEQCVTTVYAAVREDGRPLAAAVLNAGVGRGGSFVDTHSPTHSPSSTSTSAPPCTWPNWFSTT